MFGYVTIYRKGLDKAALDCYQAYYCGLCRTLGKRYGRAAQLALSYDMTFAALLLSALYEPETKFTAGRCPPHPVKPRPRADNTFIDYAADMTVLLAYYNDLDDWQDDQRQGSRRRAEQLQPFLPEIERRHPRQYRAVVSGLDALNRLEGANSHDLDALCRTFGTLLGEIFACRDDEWRQVLCGVGQGLGGFIYLMDAYDDLDRDRRRGRFNALQVLADTLPPAEYEQRCHDLLTQQMGQCAKQFEMLPILKETPEGQLLYNTIYAGVWSLYAPLRKRREGRTQ